MGNRYGGGGLQDPDGPRDELNELFLHSDPQDITRDDQLQAPTIDIDMDELNDGAKARAREITKRLSDYYFDKKYVDRHPYIPTKIANELDDIRRLIKMLSVNEKAQDTLILAISMNMAKSTIYSSLTSLQNTMLSIQQQLNARVAQLEDIFQEMQTNAEETFEDKEKEDAGDGSMVVRGSRDFIDTIDGMLDDEETDDYMPEPEPLPVPSSEEPDELHEASYDDIVG